MAKVAKPVDIYNAQRHIASIIKKNGHRKLRKIGKKHRSKIDKLIKNVLKKYDLHDTNVEGYFFKQFQVVLLGLETVVFLPAPFKLKR